MSSIIGIDWVSNMMGSAVELPETSRAATFDHSARWFVSSLFLLALVTRLLCAWDLPVTLDEEKHLDVARTISLTPGHINLPLGCGVTNHPILTMYIIALANWLGGGSIFCIRCAFILFAILGLLGLYRMTHALFGRRAALAALLFGALDHHLIIAGTVFLEPVYLNLVPWIVLAVYRAVHLDEPRQWLWVGLLFGIGYQISEVILLLAPPLALFVLYERRLRKILRAPQVYLGMAIFAAFLIPYVIWNSLHHASNIHRNIARVNSFGLTPRALLLYLGDLMIGFMNSEWILLNNSHRIYSPINVPVHWITGTLYLGAMIFALRHWRRSPQAMLLIVIAGVALPVSVLNAREPWNEFGWASATVYPAIALAGFAVDRALNHRPSRIAVFALAPVLFTFTGIFLSGAGYGYASPVWEKRFLGQVVQYMLIRDPRNDEALAVIDTALARHPDNPIVLYSEAFFGQDAQRKLAFLDKLMAIDPNSGLGMSLLIEIQKNEHRWEDLRRTAQRAIQTGHDALQFYAKIAIADYYLGNFTEAESFIEQSVAGKPDDATYLYYAFLIKDALGKSDEAQDYLNQLAFRALNPADMYVVAAKYYALNRREGLATLYYDKARREDASLPAVPAWETAPPDARSRPVIMGEMP